MSFFNTIGSKIANARGNRAKQSSSQQKAPIPSSALFGTVNGTHSGANQGILVTSTSSNDAKNSQPPLFLCQPFVRTFLVKGSFKSIVAHPKYVDYNEWLALNGEFVPSCGGLFAFTNN